MTIYAEDYFDEKIYTKEFESIIKKITIKDIADAILIQHTFNHKTFGESLLYVLRRLK